MMQPVSAESFEKYQAQGATVVDTRDGEALRKAFIKGSIAMHSIEKLREYIGVFSGFAKDGGLNPVLLVCDKAEELKWAEQLQRTEIDVKGYLEGGFEAWVQANGAIDIIIDVEADELIMDIPFDDNLVVVDIRPPVAFANGHLKDAVNLPLAYMADPLRLSAIEDKDNLYLIGNNDADGFLAATVLKRQDIHNLRVVLGGWDAVQKEKKAKVVKEQGMWN